MIALVCHSSLFAASRLRDLGIPDSTIQFQSASLSSFAGIGSPRRRGGAAPRIADTLHQTKPNLIILTDPDSEVIVDSVVVGTGRTEFLVSPGLHSIQTVHPEAGTTRKVINKISDRVIVLEMYNKPLKTAIWLSSPVPGVAQFRKNEPMKGSLLFVGAAVTVYAAIAFQGNFKRDNAAAEHLSMLYRQAITEREALDWGEQASLKFAAAKQAARFRDMALSAAVIIWVLHLIDAFTEPAGGYRIPPPLDASVSSTGSLNLSLTFPFNPPGMP